MKKIFALLLVLIPFYLSGQNPTGRWIGKLYMSSQVKLKLIIEIQKKGDGYSSKLISVDQGNAVVPSDITTIEGDKLAIKFSAMGADYTATIASHTLKGTFSQNGKNFPLTLNRSNIKAETQPNRPQNPKAPFTYKVEDVEFINHKEGNKLAGTLTTPNDPKAKTAVVLISGSGPQNRDQELFGHKPFWVLADHLSRQGIAVLRYDDRGVGKSSKLQKESTTADLAYDAEAAVKFLRDHYSFENVGIIGHSEGGMIAFMLAGNKAYTAPDFVISIAGPGIKGAEILNQQQEHALTRMGLSPATIEQTMSLNKALYAVILQSSESDHKSVIAAKLEKILKANIPANVSADVANKKINQTVSQVTAPWLYHFIKYDPTESIKHTKCPVLAINGSLDCQVSAKENLTAIERALKEGGNNNFKTLEMEGLNHLMQPAKTGETEEYATIETTFDQSALTVISQWIKAIN